MLGQSTTSLQGWKKRGGPIHYSCMETWGWRHWAGGASAARGAVKGKDAEDGVKQLQVLREAGSWGAAALGRLGGASFASIGYAELVQYVRACTSLYLYELVQNCD